MEAMGHQQVHHLPRLFMERHLTVKAHLIQAMTLNLLLPSMVTMGKLRIMEVGVVPAIMVTHYTFPSPGSFSSTYPYFAYPR